MADEARLPWVVIYTNPQGAIRAVINVKNQGAEFYYPRVLVRSARKAVLKPAPFFPGYAFARHPEGRWAFLRGTFGVLGVVMGMGGKPALLPDAELTKIRAREGPDGFVRLTSRLPERGERVRMEKGAFASFDAIVDSMSGEERVWVLMNVLGYAQRVEVDLKDISE